MNSILKNKIIELMHGINKRLSYTVYSYIDKTLSKPLARVHPGFVSCLGLKAVFVKLTIQNVMCAILHLFFFLCGLHALKKERLK